MAAIIGRVALVNTIVLVTLGVLAAKYAPPALSPSVSLPWTLWIVLIVALGIANVRAFSAAARWNSAQLIAENRREPRLVAPVKYATVGGVVWAAVPIKGFRFLGIRLNSQRNRGLAIVPADMLECAVGDYFIVARCTLYTISQRTLQILAKSRAFLHLFREFGVDTKSEQTGYVYYMGFGSRTLHPDFLHLTKSRNEIEEYARSLAKDEIAMRQVVDGIFRQLDSDVRRWKTITGSHEAGVVVKRIREEEQ